MTIHLGTTIDDSTKDSLGDLASDDGRDLEGATDTGRQPVDASHHAGQERVRDCELLDVAVSNPAVAVEAQRPALDQRPKHFLDEERVAVGSLQDEVFEMTG